MKYLFTFISSFLVCLSVFSQQMMEKRYYENSPPLGGDVVIKSSSVKVEKDDISKTFEIECSNEGAYYMDAWIMAPFTKEGYLEFKVAVNGVLSEFSFKPQTDGWHSLALTDAKKSAVAVNLKKGINTISVMEKGPEVPSVEFIKLSSDFSRAVISDSKYREYVESIKNNTVNNLINRNAVQTNSTRGTNNEIYDYYLNIPYSYTTYKLVSYSSGQNVNVTLGSSSFPCAIEIFSKTNPESYSWHVASSTGPSNLNVTIPVGGIYFLLIRSLSANNAGIIPVTIDGHVYNDWIVAYSPQYAVTPNYPTPTNFFTCGIGDEDLFGGPWLYLADKTEYIRAWNEYGGTKSDNYYWRTSRITTSLTGISYGMVFSEVSYEPYYTCDLYMGLQSADKSSEWNTFLPKHFLKLPADNSFLSGPRSPYNCIAWSVGDTTLTQPFHITMETWDAFYGEYGYTREGADSINGVIALWGYILKDGNDSIIGVDYRHASVRKHPKAPFPHGFEWESKIGPGRDRIMHTRDAVANPNSADSYNYGSILYYYRPDPTKTVKYSLPVSSKTLESSFSASELNRITALKDNIPSGIKSDFDAKYLIWEKTWDRPEIAIHSNPFVYAKSSEYENLLAYCMKYGKAIWPLVFDKLEQGDIYVISLLRDLTYTGKGNFSVEITRSASVKIPSLYTMQVDYCKRLLVKEEANIQKSIQDISAAKEESFTANITVAGGEIQLSLQTGKDEKALVRIYNAFGGLEYEANYTLSTGSQTIVINASRFNKGIYVVQITIESKTISQTISI